MTSKITIISFNMLGVPVVPTRMSKRFLRITEEFEKKQADVIALQEVHTVRQLRRLVRFLPSYPYVAFKSYLGGPKGGLVVFSKLPIESYGYVNLSKRKAPSGKFFLSKISRKGVLICKFKDVPLHLLNTQLMANLDSDWSPDNRFMPLIRTQLSEIKDLVKEYRQQEENVVLVGDFNIPKDGALYNIFVEETQVTDAFKAFDFPTLHMWFFSDWKVLSRIDFIFYTGDSITVKNQDHLFTDKYKITRTFDGYLSDHIALTTDLEFTE